MNKEKIPTYIEPCCCDRQLPELFRNDIVFFQTNGDVTEDKLLTSVSHLVGDGAILVYTNYMIDGRFLKVIKHYFERGWISGVILLCDTETVVTEVTRQHIVATLGDYLENVHFAVDPLIVNSQMVLVGEKKFVVIRGDLSMTVNFGMSMFAGICSNYPEDNVMLYSALAGTMAKARLKAVIDGRRNKKIDSLLKNCNLV